MENILCDLEEENRSLHQQLLFTSTNYQFGLGWSRSGWSLTHTNKSKFMIFRTFYFKWNYRDYGAFTSYIREYRKSLKTQEIYGLLKPWKHPTQRILDHTKLSKAFWLNSSVRCSSFVSKFEGDKSWPQSSYHDGSYKTKNTRVAEPRQAKGKLPTETNKPNKKQER